MTERRTFLGLGWQFPPVFHTHELGASMTANEQNIYDSILAIVTTARGERIMHTKFGCDLKEDIFESTGTTEITRMKNKIMEALLFFEPRINVQKIEIDFSEQLAGKLDISVDYTIISTNTRTNIVFPYYKKEATDI